ncbi:MAG TPA: hypothetical protein DCZ51_14120 [Bacteroidales bacterium]|nr:hypothetical protein [Bacteroidales bacterium]
MKKVLIGIGTILILACVVILFVNANGSRKESKKARTEVCDPATCPSHQTEAKTATPACGQTSSCTGACGSKATGVK